MLKPIKENCAVFGLMFLLGGLAPSLARAEEPLEKAGVAIGLTVGNALFLPAKAVSVSMGLITGAASLLFFGGNGEVANQIWRDTTQGPYIITPELAKTAVGERPELDSD
ncbi:MAG: hypothetical protein ACREQ7_04510 [Candidatus Binatia bacterium]